LRRCCRGGRAKRFASTTVAVDVASVVVDDIFVVIDVVVAVVVNIVVFDTGAIIVVVFDKEPLSALTDDGDDGTNADDDTTAIDGDSTSVEAITDDFAFSFASDAASITFLGDSSGLNWCDADFRFASDAAIISARGNSSGLNRFDGDKPDTALPLELPVSGELPAPSQASTIAYDADEYADDDDDDVDDDTLTALVLLATLALRWRPSTVAAAVQASTVVALMTGEIDVLIDTDSGAAPRNPVIPLFATDASEVEDGTVTTAVVALSVTDSTAAVVVAAASIDSVFSTSVVAVASAVAFAVADTSVVTDISFAEDNASD
jgi:hypothetical protein